MKPISSGTRNARLAAAARERLRRPPEPGAPVDLEALSRAWTETAAYASRLAVAPGALIYEEMFKLLSLIDDLDALAKVGATVDDEIRELVRREVSQRIAGQRRMAAMVARDLVDENNADVWPFSELAHGR